MMNDVLQPEEVAALKNEIFSSMRCALPGIVESFDENTQTASIRPGVKGKNGTELPLLTGVPVFMPVSFTVSEGDACLVIFADFDTDAFLANGEVTAPRSGRMHSISDGFAFVGFRMGGQG